MNILGRVRSFFCAQKCMGCGEILDYGHVDRAFCQRCKSVWNRAILEECPRCHGAAYHCMCMPKPISSAGAICLRRLMFYKSSSSYDPQIAYLYYHKRMQVSRLLEFLSGYVLSQIREEMDTAGIGDDAVITFVPRSRRSYMTYGFDQSEVFARLLAEKLGLECVKVFKTKPFARAQKKLDAKGRLKNARKSIQVDDTADVANKYVILIDDVVTSGAGMSVCVKHLRALHCRGVLCFCLASKDKM